MHVFILFLIIFFTLPCLASENKSFAQTKTLSFVLKSNHDSKSILTYALFTKTVDGIVRALCTRFLTENVQLVYIQSTIDMILRQMLGETKLLHLGDPCLDDPRKNTEDSNEKASFKATFLAFRTSDLVFFVKRKLSNAGKWVSRMNNYIEDSIYKFYPVITTSVPPSSKTLFEKLICLGINLNYLMDKVPRLMLAYELGDNSYDRFDTLAFNDYLRKIIDKRLKITSTSFQSLFKFLTKNVFKKKLNGQVYYMEQGSDNTVIGNLYMKPCALYNENWLWALGYHKETLNAIEKSRVPIIPKICVVISNDSIFYCLDTVKIESQNSQTIISKAMPMIKLSKGTILATYIKIPRTCFESFLKAHIISDVKQDTKSASNDVNVKSTMARLAKYLHSKLNKDIKPIRY